MITQRVTDAFLRMFHKKQLPNYEKQWSTPVKPPNGGFGGMLNKPTEAKKPPAPKKPRISHKNAAFNIIMKRRTYG